ESGLFTSSNRFFRKTIEADPALKAGFWEANDAAIRLCEREVAQNRKNQEALYACGNAYAARAAYQGMMERSKVDSLSNGRRANAFHSELLRLNSEFYDANLVPGLYDFILGSLPRTLKLFLLLGGFSGDRQKGLQLVELAAERGDRSQP